MPPIAVSCSYVGELPVPRYWRIPKGEFVLLKCVTPIGGHHAQPEAGGPNRNRNRAPGPKVAPIRYRAVGKCQISGKKSPAEAGRVTPRGESPGVFYSFGIGIGS